MKTLAAAVGVAVALAFPGISEGQTKTDPVLNKLAADFQAAYNAKDAARVASLYAEDAVMMPPGETMVKGRSAIEARFRRDMQQNVTLKISPTESAIIGDRAYEVGTIVVTMPDGKPMSEKYMVVLERVGNDWKIAYDIWNSDTPPPPQK